MPRYPEEAWFFREAGQELKALRIWYRFKCLSECLTFDNPTTTFIFDAYDSLYAIGCVEATTSD